MLVFRGLFDEMIKEFDLIFEKIGRVSEIVLLGDVKHVFGGVIKQEWDDVLGLFDYFYKWCEKIVIVKGNHDIFLPSVARKKEIGVLESYVIENIGFVHGDKKVDVVCKVLVVGHGHPAVRIKDNVRVEKYKCFLVGRWKGKKIIIMPSFFSGNEGSDPLKSDLGRKWGFDLEKFEVKVVDGLGVLEFGELGELG